MDWSVNYNGTGNYQQQPLNANTFPNKYKGMVQVLPTLPTSQKPVSVNGYNGTNGSEARNFTQSNFNVGFTPTMTVTSQTSDVPRIRPPPPSPRANLQQRKGRDEKSKAAFHKSMFDLRDVGQDSFQRPQQPQSMAPTPTLFTSTPRPGYPCYDRRSLNMSYQDLRDVGHASSGTPQVQQQQSMLQQFQNTHHNQQNRFSFNTGTATGVDNRAFPTAITPKMPELQYFKPQLPPSTPTMQYIQPPNVPASAINTQNDDMKSLHDDMAQLRLELASMKDFMMEEEEFQSKQVQELKQLQIQFQESSKLIQDQKPKKEKEPSSQFIPKFNSLPIITASPKANLLPPKSPKPTLLVKPTAPSKTSPHPDFASMKNPIKELEQRFNMRTKQEENPKKQSESEHSIEPIKLPPKKISSIAPVFQKTTYPTSPKSPKPVTSVKPLTSPSNQLRRSYSVTPTNPSQQSKLTQPSRIVFPKTDPLVPPTKAILSDQMNGDKNNNYPIAPSNNYSGETKSKPVGSSNVKVKRISQMFEGNLNETNEIRPQQNGSPHYDPKIGGGTIKRLSPALLQSIQASEESKLSGTQANSRHIAKSTNLNSKFEVPKLETTNIPRDLPESPRVPPILKSSPALSQVSPTTKPNVTLYSSPVKPLVLSQVSLATKPYNVPPSPVKHSQTKNILPVSLAPVLPPSPPPASLKPSTINEPPPPQYKEEIDSPYSSQIPLPDDISEQLPPTFSFTPESPQTTLKRYSNVPEPEYDHQQIAQVANDDSVLPPTSEVTTYKHRYENVPDSKQEANNFVEISVPDYLPPLPPKDFLPDQSTSQYINEELTSLNQQDRIYAEPATPQSTEIQHPYPTTPLLTINSQQDNLTGTAPPCSTLRKTSIPVIIRPNTAPPPPPPTSVPTHQTEQSKPPPQTSPALPIIVSPSSPPPPPPIPTEIFIPSPPPQPEYILENTTPAYSQSLHRRTSSSGISSTASIPGSPLSPVGTASKSHLLEQIRQFKESGKGLKKANENEEQAGTPTRVRRNSIQDALLTRFKAFSGNQSESSEDEQNNIEDDWED